MKNELKTKTVQTILIFLKNSLKERDLTIVG